MVPKWFDKSPRKSNADNVDDLRGLAAQRSGGLYRDRRTAHGLRAFRRALPRVDRCSARRRGSNALVASYGPALLDRAVLDALCRSLRLSFAAVVRANLPGIDATLTPDLAVSGLERFIARCGHARPSPRATPSACSIR